MPEKPLTSLILPDRYLEIVRNLLNSHVPGREVWAYGSRVNGGGYEASDLDLVLLPDTNDDPDKSPWESGNQYAALKEAFQESILPLFIDVMNWEWIPESFHEQILNGGYVILQRL